MAYLVYSIFPTELGWIALVGSDRGVRRLVLPQPSASQALKLALENAPGAINDNLHFRDLRDRLRDYSSGKAVDFSHDTLDLPDTSDFRRKVWKTVSDIPYGETRTYRWVAQACGRPEGARAVGQAMAANPIPILIPCHRVVAISGPGGYAGGLPLKHTLLDLESPPK